MGTSEHITIVCRNCETKLKVRGDDAGRRVICPKCKNVFQVKEDDRVERSQSDGAEPARPSATSACPHCKAALAPGAVICVSCGTNVQTGEHHQLAKAESKIAGGGTASRRGDGSRSLLYGCIGCAIGTGVGTAAWIACALYTKHELAVLGILLGGLSGLGMYVGHRNVGLAAGLVAALMAMGGIVTARIFILKRLFEPDASPAELVVPAIFATGVWGLAFVGLAMFIAFKVGASGPDALDDD